MSDSSDSEYSDSDAELQDAFVKGLLKPGLNKGDAQKKTVNNVGGLRQKLQEFKLNLPWIEVLESVSKQAPLAPELAARMLEQEQKHVNQLKNNKKLPQVSAADDPVLNDFKREMMFYRQAQATVLESITKLKALGLPISRPDDYFAEMVKSDDHMQNVRGNLMKKLVKQEHSDKVKHSRDQRKDGKALQLQNSIKKQQEKKQILDKIKKVRKGVTKELNLLENPNKDKNTRNLSKNSVEKRKRRDQKFGFGGKKKGSKQNTKDSVADTTKYRKPLKSKNKTKNTKIQLRPGKNRRIKLKNRKGRKTN